MFWDVFFYKKEYFFGEWIFWCGSELLGYSRVYVICNENKFYVFRF